MSSPEDDPFCDLGYTSSEQGEDLHAEQMERQKIDKVTDSIARRKNFRPRRSSYVRDYGSDRDHIDEMAAIPEGFVEEPYEGERLDNPRLIAHIIARRAKLAHMREEFGEDSPQYRIVADRYNRDHPLDGFDQPKGA